MLVRECGGNRDVHGIPKLGDDILHVGNVNTHANTTDVLSFPVGCASSSGKKLNKKIKKVARIGGVTPITKRIGPRGAKRKENGVDESLLMEEGLGMLKKQCREGTVVENDMMDESYGSVTVAEVGITQPHEEQ